MDSGVCRKQQGSRTDFLDRRRGKWRWSRPRRSGRRGSIAASLGSPSVCVGPRTCHWVHKVTEDQQITISRLTIPLDQAAAITDYVSSAHSVNWSTLHMCHACMCHDPTRSSNSQLPNRVTLCMHCAQQVSQGSTIEDDAGIVCDFAPPPNHPGKFQGVYIPATRTKSRAGFALLRDFPASVLRDMRHDPDLLADEARLARLHNATLQQHAPHLMARHAMQGLATPAQDGSPLDDGSDTDPMED